MRAQHPTIARALGRVRDPLQRALTVSNGPRRVLLACSGGADSVALVGLVARLRRSMALELALGHVDHGLRAASVDEACLVRDLAGSLAVPCFVTRLDLAPGSGLPARARVARRAALVEHARSFGARVIALGHTATDQVETMLLHLARGAGLEGLAAMAAVDLPWCRPLLDLTRAETRALAQRLQLAFVDDPTNDDRRHARVALRRDVLPQLARINPQFERAFVSASRRAAQADAALEEWAREVLVASRCEPGHWSWTGLSKVPAGVRMRVLRDICRDAGAELERLSAGIIEQIDVAIIAQATARQREDHSVRPKAWDLTPRVRICVNKHGIFATASPAANH